MCTTPPVQVKLQYGSWQIVAGADPKARLRRLSITFEEGVSHTKGGEKHYPTGRTSVVAEIQCPSGPIQTVPAQIF